MIQENKGHYSIAPITLRDSLWVASFSAAFSTSRILKLQRIVGSRVTQMARRLAEESKRQKKKNHERLANNKEKKRGKMWKKSKGNKNKINETMWLSSTKGSER